MKRYFLALSVFFLLCCGIFAQEAKKNPWAFEPDSKLPNVLILGDSISIGYTVPVRKMLEGKANVYRPMNAKGDGPVNCGNTKIGLANIDRWLDVKQNGGKPWNVIQFNWGLWDVTYRNPPNQDNKGERDKIKGGVSFTPEQYGENLEKLVERLKKTGAKLVWANISYIPEGEGARVVGDDVKYNAVAEAIMKNHGIPTNDIYGLTSKMDKTLFVGPGDVHYKADGSKKIAEQVVRHIETALKEKQAVKKNPWFFEPDPTLPDVLILGDSISIGYTVPVRKLLDGKANVWRPMNAKGDGPENCGNTKMGLKNIDRFLDTKRLDGRKWAVIHFNWGLWDINRRIPHNQDNTGVRDKVKGTISFTPEEYAANLEKLVEKLEATGAKLIWGSTSYVPDGEEGRAMGDEVRYNAVAAEVMKKHGIPVNDICSLTSKFEPEMFQKPGDVHYMTPGSEKIAEQTAEIIEKRLAEKSE